MTRTECRRPARIMAGIDRITKSDARFFERFPHRSHRVRIAAQVKILGHEVVTGGKLEAADKFFTAVKQIAPGIRIRAIVGGYSDNDTELSEDETRAVLEMAIDRLAPVRL
jgi:hypothetical protein